MAAEGVPGSLAWRVVNQNTGAEVIHSLPHLHQTQAQVLAIQPGAPGGAAIGAITIPLHVPGSDDYKAAKPFYDLLTPGQKLEGYLGGVVAGTPRFSCVLQSWDKSHTAYRLNCLDTLWWLQQSTVIPNELTQFAGATADNILGQFKTCQEVVVDDTCTSLANYTQTPAARWTTATEPLTSATSFTCSTTGSESYLVNNTAPAAWQWFNARVDAFYYVIAGSDATNAGEATVVVASDATAANCTFGRANLYTSGGKTVVDGEIWSRTASVNTKRAFGTAILTLPSNASRFQLTMTSYYQGSLSYWALFVNGTLACTWNWGNGVGNPTGRWGARFNATAGGTPQVWLDRISMRARNQNVGGPRFASGTVSAGTVAGTWNNCNGQTDLDLCIQGAALENWYIRKNPGAGYKTDSLDLGAAPGTDFSNQIRFSYGDNLVDLQLTANGESYATDLRVAATPGADLGGTVTYPAVGTGGDLVVTDTILNTSITSFGAALTYASNLRALKAAPGQAKTARVIRDPATADKYRELDYVTVHDPELGLINQKVLVMGYTFYEGQPYQDLVLDQYPASLQALGKERVQLALEMVAGLYKTR